jgi:type IV secretory pathway ATPase VirB11/archaellum biosynthesis ATPase
MNSVTEAITTEDADKVKEALERLKNSSMEIGKAIYSQQQQQQSSEGSQDNSQEPKKEEENKSEEKK